MRFVEEKYRFLGWTGLVIFLGFLASGILSHRLSRATMERAITGQTLPLSGEAIHAAIRAELPRPTVIASAMAHDRFVHDWLLEGETDGAAMANYLADIKTRHGAQGVYLVSERTRQHYNAQGARNPVTESEARDAWYFRARSARTPYVIDLTAETGRSDAPTIFVNHRLQDEAGNLIGVAGVGLRADALARTIQDFTRRYGQRIRLVDTQGRSVLGAPVQPGLPEALLHQGGDPVTLRSRRSDTGADAFISSRFIPELGWHVLVEQQTGDAALPAWQAMALHLAIGGFVAMLILPLLQRTLYSYQARVERMAGTDTLTGMPNRQAFEIVLRQAMLEADRSGRPLSGILFDIDYFKQVNDRHGHAAGDEVLRTISRIAKAMLRESDIITRWGGEEFVVLLKECSIEQAVVVAEKLRSEIDHYDFSAIAPDQHITISLGVTEHQIGAGPIGFFDRADEALFKAKANGRNRLQVARSRGNMASAS